MIAIITIIVDLNKEQPVLIHVLMNFMKMELNAKLVLQIARHVLTLQLVLFARQDIF